MTLSEIKALDYQNEIHDLQYVINTETDVLTLRNAAARLKYILDIVMKDQTGFCPSDD